MTILLWLGLSDFKVCSLLEWFFIISVDTSWDWFRRTCMTTLASRLVRLNYSNLARSFSEMKSGSWLKANDTFTLSFEGQLNIAPARQLLISVLCCYLLSESNYRNMFFPYRIKKFEVQPSSCFEPETWPGCVNLCHQIACTS